MYIHKYRPLELDNVLYNKDLVNKIMRMNEIENCLFYGIKGSGKKTILMALLNKLYGDEVHLIKSNSIIVKGINTGVKYKYSKFHIEIDLSMYSSKNKDVLLEFIKTYASTYNILTKKPKIIILLNAHLIPLSIQFALRRIIEIYNMTARFIFISQAINKIIKPVCSRLTLIRVRGINKQEAKHILEHICVNEKIKINNTNITKIIKRCSNYNNTINITNIVNCINRSYVVVPDEQQSDVQQSDVQIIKFKYKKQENLLHTELDKLYELIINNNLTTEHFMKIKSVINKLYLDNINEMYCLKYILYKILDNDYEFSIKCKLIEIMSHSNIHLGNKTTLFFENIIFKIISLLQ